MIKGLQKEELRLGEKKRSKKESKLNMACKRQKERKWKIGKGQEVCILQEEQ